MAGMTDPMAMGGQPSPEQMRAYLEQLRDADAAGLLAEAFNLLATGAQVKLGRPDARALIDGLAGLVEGASPALPAQLAAQMQQGIAQLQMAQVEAEREVAAQAEGAGAGEQASGEQDADADASSATQPPPAPPGAGGPPGPPPGQRMTDRLWVPGRDPRPPTAR